MPEATELTINKDGEKTSFGPIIYTIPEDYKYTIKRKFEETKYFTFDAAEYNVTVRVLNDENGSIYAVFWVGDTQSTDKPTEIAFTNTYYKPGSGGDNPGGFGGGGGTTSGEGAGVTEITDGDVPATTILLLLRHYSPDGCLVAYNYLASGAMAAITKPPLPL